jgi:hypothetical protein
LQPAKRLFVFVFFLLHPFVWRGDGGGQGGRSPGPCAATAAKRWFAASAKTAERQRRTDIRETPEDSRAKIGNEGYGLSQFRDRDFPANGAMDLRTHTGMGPGWHFVKDRVDQLVVVGRGIVCFRLRCCGRPAGAGGGGGGGQGGGQGGGAG